MKEKVAVKGTWDDVKRVFTLKNLPAIGTVGSKMLMGKGIDVCSLGSAGWKLAD